MQTRTVKLSWTAAADGSVADIPMPLANYNFLQGYGYLLYAMTTNPGTTAPTDNYDIVIEDADGTDILGGAGANRDASTTETVQPLINGLPAPYPMDGALTVKVSGNIVNAATGTITLMFVG